MRVELLGTGGGAPSARRETACALVRDGDGVLLLDAGSGARRLLERPGWLDGVSRIDIVLTHFHADHVSALPYLGLLGIESVTLWAPGAWLYGRPSAAILEPLCSPPIAATDLRPMLATAELRPGEQQIGNFAVRASPQPRHWAPSAGLRIGDELALITDTPYEPAGCELAAGVAHLLHEAWSPSSEPRYPERDATAADAARVAREAGVGALTLIHLDPRLDDHGPLLEDAAAGFEHVRLGEDLMVVAGIP